MRFSQWLSVGVAIAGLTIVPMAKAEMPHSLGRHLGVGWGDGYHSRTTCLPKRGVICFPAAETAPVNGPVPWWKIPSAEGERLPAPPASQPSGASLFRQPGEGSSVTVR